MRIVFERDPEPMPIWFWVLMFTMMIVGFGGVAAYLIVT